MRTLLRVAVVSAIAAVLCTVVQKAISGRSRAAVTGAVVATAVVFVLMGNKKT